MPRMPVSVRPMTDDEFARMRAKTVSHYAAENVRAGRWTAEVAEAKSAEQLDELLPAGLATPGQVFLVAEDEQGAFVGHVWVEVADPRSERPGAWIFDIEVVEGRRGEGFGRDLLAAAERAAAEAGAPTIGLNVFGHNTVAVTLYEKSGYSVATQQMSKPLRPGSATRR